MAVVFIFDRSMFIVVLPSSVDCCDFLCVFLSYFFPQASNL